MNIRCSDSAMRSSVNLFCFSVEQYRKDRKLKALGMPHYVGHGSHELNDLRHRFVVMPRYGRDVWSYFIENGNLLPQPTIYRIAIQMVSGFFCGRNQFYFTFKQNNNYS